MDGVRANSIHDGGRVRFGPDGKIYWTVGDAGADMLAQDPSVPNGKIHRLETDGSAPADNPWPGSTVYSYGNRNAQGLAWQPGTGRALRHRTRAERSSDLLPGRGDPEEMLARTMAGRLLQATSSARDGFANLAERIQRDVGARRGNVRFVRKLVRVASVHGLARPGALSTHTRSSGLTPKREILEPVIQGQFGRLRDIVEGPDGAYYLLTSNRDGRGSPSRKMTASCA